MTNPEELLLLAKNLRKGSNEVELRAAASRGYYALYHFAKTFHAGLLEPGAATQHGAGGDHLDLAHRLKMPSMRVQSETPGAATKSRRIGVLLDSVRVTRHIADYNLGQAFGSDLADLVIHTAEKTFKI